MFLSAGAKKVEAARRLVRALGVEHACTFGGPFPRESLARVFEGASIGIIQRRDMAANHLVVTGKLFDYWSTKLAVIATRLKGIQEVAQDRQNILFCEPQNPKAMADCILELLGRRNVPFVTARPKRF